MCSFYKKIKYLFFVTYVFCLCSNKLYAQQAVAPEKLPQDVQRFFPVVYQLDDSVSVAWSFVDSVYVASFISEMYPVKVFMKENGFWIKTLWQIGQEFVPQNVIKNVKSDFSEYSIVRCFISNNPFHEVHYFLHLQNEKSNGVVEAKYTSKGNQMTDN
jgi:hypothetical protein